MYPDPLRPLDVLDIQNGVYMPHIVFVHRLVNYAKSHFCAALCVIKTLSSGKRLFWLREQLDMELVSY